MALSVVPKRFNMLGKYKLLIREIQLVLNMQCMEGVYITIPALATMRRHHA
jgi:hypothetical protein